ncbi:MAG TPA: hypothetical protein VFE61_21680 [Candidatus Sulfotelmatobacter sp.]|jgi:hypothetical protein|nr:hypothetical protein [Candidatus Sulfotelmatobacter sp.]
MKRFLPILVLVCSLGSHAGDRSQNAPQASPQTASPASTEPAISPDQENARKARAVIDQAIQALGGSTYLGIRDREQQGRGFTFHHGRPSGEGALIWSFSEFPDKERVEYTKERDVARVYVGTKGYEITYKGAKPIEEKDMVDYLRLRHCSLETVLRTWVNDPGVLFLYEGNAIADQHPALQVTLINTNNESVTLDVDVDTHLPIKKSFEWRDPVDRQKNLEEEIYGNYRAVSGIMAPYNVTRYFNGDMAAQRVFFNVTINQGLDQAMFDPNSGYNPNKQPGKQSGKR